MQASAERRARLEKRASILHLEDDRADGELIQGMLEAADLVDQITRVEKEYDFRRALENGGYDVILADHNLPGYDGISAMRQAHAQCPEVPFIFVSGAIGEDAAIEALTQGATDYVLKHKIQRLVPAVRRALAEAQTRRERHDAVALLRERETLLDGVLNSSSSWIIACRPVLDSNSAVADFEIELLNRAAEGMTGYPCAQSIGMSLRNRIVANFDGLFESMAQVYESGIAHQRDYRVSNQTVQRWMQVTVVKRENGLVITASDITESKRIQAELEQSRSQLRELATHLLKARESERTAIAREIHDELGQLLTALKMDLFWLRGNLEKARASERARKLVTRVGDMVEIVETAISSVRQIASDLRPPALDELGLIAVVEWQAQEFQKRTGIACLMKNTLSDPHLSAEEATALFRIVQEALTNVARHAQASQVRIRLEANDGELQLELADNGRGIMPEEIQNSHSFGVIGMHERAMLIGANLEISGKPGQGTRVLVRVPAGSSRVLRAERSGGES